MTTIRKRANDPKGIYGGRRVRLYTLPHFPITFQNNHSIGQHTFFSEDFKQGSSSSAPLARCFRIFPRLSQYASRFPACENSLRYKAYSEDEVVVDVVIEQKNGFLIKDTEMREQMQVQTLDHIIMYYLRCRRRIVTWNSTL